MPVRRPHELRHDARQPVAVVVVKRGLCSFGGLAAVRSAGNGDVAIALRHNPLETAEDRGSGSHYGSSRMDFIVRKLSVSTGVRSGLREPARLLVAADHRYAVVPGFGIAYSSPKRPCFLGL